MQSAFEILGNTTVPRRFCIFIDGLDEYEGDYQIGINTLKQLVTNPNIKVVVSSRPITLCVEAFSRMPKLFMHDLNRQDITNYAQDTVGNHPGMQELLNAYPSEATVLLKDLEVKSLGVFLWVVLACRSLQDGFAAYDRISDLQRRVDELPSELEEMFQHILGKIEPRYRTQAARMLRVVHTAGVSKKIPFLGMAILEDADYKIQNIRMSKSTPALERTQKCSMLANRLRSRCIGLLEPYRKTSTPLECFCSETPNFNCDNILRWGHHDDLVDSEVSFMHRTVHDFLDTPGIWSLPVLMIQDDSLDDNLSFFCILLPLALLVLDRKSVLAEKVFERAISVASKIKKPSSVRQAITKLEDFSSVFVNQQGDFTAPVRLPLFNRSVKTVGSVQVVGLLIAIEAGLLLFVREYEMLQEVSAISQQIPLLDHVIRYPFFGEYFDKSDKGATRSSNMLCYLLSAGCDPNEVLDAPWSAWQLWIRGLTCSNTIDACLIPKILKSFIKAGARVEDVEACIGESLDSRIKWLFGVGLSWDATLRMYQKRFEGYGIGYINMFEEKQHPVIMQMGLEILKYLKERSIRKESELEGAPSEVEKEIESRAINEYLNQQTEEEILMGPFTTTSIDFVPQQFAKQWCSPTSDKEPRLLGRTRGIVFKRPLPFETQPAAVCIRMKKKLRRRGPRNGVT